MTSRDEGRRMVVVCSHVLETGKPILFARRDPPTEPVDTGWQVICNLVEENENTCRLISVDELVAMDRSIEAFLALPVGTVLTRDGPTAKWTIKTG